jgi:hypothetical protein
MPLTASLINTRTPNLRDQSYEGSNVTIRDYDAINDALEVCSDLGFEMVPGFATHWAMGSETLIALGQAELVHSWATRYRTMHRHYERPAAAEPIDQLNESSWRNALGDFDRAGDWQLLFESALADAPWKDVLATWWPRLIPGVAAGLTHGLIRTAHAVRGIARTGRPATNLQLRELATGLAYWAGRYVEQPSAAASSLTRPLHELLTSIPRRDGSSRVQLQELGKFRHMPNVDGWPAAVAQLGMPDDIGAGLSDLTLTFARVNLAHFDQFPVPLIHTVTAPAALRLMLPHLPPETHAPSFWAVWQAAAALLTTFALEPRPTEQSYHPVAPTLSEAEIAARAIENGDEHAIKFAEACLREHAIRPDPAYLAAAEQMLGRIRPIPASAAPS